MQYRLLKVGSTMYGEAANNRHSNQARQDSSPPKHVVECSNQRPLHHPSKVANPIDKAGDSSPLASTSTLTDIHADAASNNGIWPAVSRSHKEEA